ncbi:thermonuclease family protein [Rubritalea spongiae]|uniref:Thermonuclease family protein n=1 Tax=Rubritalea spongiae TaxID=430797 RepID=A0ABW5E465_9BACT
MAKKKSVKNTLIVLVILAAYFIFKGEDSEPRAPISELSIPETVDGSYEVLKNCRLVKNSRNDGDSFFVKHTKGETEFRLYYVDAPESAYKEYRNGENNGERLDDQAAYFGTQRERAIEVGIEAKDLTHYLLDGGAFKVLTKWENVYGPERKYAFIVVKEAGREVYLHEVLVQNGLGRIHTKPAPLPSGVSSQVQLKKLRDLERRAKEQQLGAWAQ